MRESINIIHQCINKIQPGFVKKEKSKVVPPTKLKIKYNMESLIQHFKFFSQGFSLVPSEIYLAIEAPKGENGVSIVSQKSKKPYRCKIRTPGFFHLQGLRFLSSNQVLADLVTIIGSLDIVLGEVDR